MVISCPVSIHTAVNIYGLRAVRCKGLAFMLGFSGRANRTETLLVEKRRYVMTGDVFEDSKSEESGFPILCGSAREASFCVYTGHHPRLTG